MGFFDELFGGTPSAPSTPSSGGFFGSLFSGTPEPTAPRSSPFSYGEPVLPTASQATGYGGQRFSSRSEADKSCLQDYGVVTDPDTGYVGTPAQIYDKYLAEGRNPERLVQRYRKW